MSSPELETYRRINAAGLSVDLLVIIETVILGLWMMMALVPGFALYTVDPSIVLPSSGWAYSVSHIGWWAMIELIVVVIGHRSTKFKLQIPGSKRLQLGLEYAEQWLIFHAVALILAGASDVVHIVLTGLEIGARESTFYVQQGGWLITFLCALCIQLIFVKMPLLWCVYHYRKELTSSHEKHPPTLGVFETPPEENTLDEAGNARVLAVLRNNTPLLAKATMPKRSGK
jgi:hypothetical protein